MIQITHSVSPINDVKMIFRKKKTDFTIMEPLNFFEISKALQYFEIKHFAFITDAW